MCRKALGIGLEYVGINAVGCTSRRPVVPIPWRTDAAVAVVANVMVVAVIAVVAAAAADTKGIAAATAVEIATAEE